MNDLRKAAEMALETLCVGANDVVPNDIDERFEQAIQALRQALDDKPAVKTYAGGKPNYCTPLQSDRIRIDPVTGDVSIGTVDAVNMTQDRVGETAKGEHEWVGLTDEEIVDLACSVDSYKGLVQAVEAKLKEKNVPQS